MPPSIFPGPWRLDKLPVWITVPLGAAGGALAGRRIVQAEDPMLDIVLIAACAAVILWCGLSAPRAIPAEPRPGEADPAEASPAKASPG